ncbi:MAG: hypothetical protein ACJ780_06720 [Solirubrobacteraceae bacterium]
MRELERKLVDLGRTIRESDPPPVTHRVIAELREQGPPARQFPLRRLAAVAVAIVAVAAAAAVAVPSARTSALRFFHLRGETITRVDKLPQVPPRGPLAPGRMISLADARSRVSSWFALMVPKHDRTPAHTFYYGLDPPGGQVTLVYGSLRRPRLLVTEFEGRHAGRPFSKKAPSATTVEPVKVGEDRAIWLGGAKHAFSFVDEFGTSREVKTRLAGNTLIWQQGNVTLRLEADISKAAAIKLAGSFVTAK